MRKTILVFFVVLSIGSGALFSDEWLIPESGKYQCGPEEYVVVVKTDNKILQNTISQPNFIWFDRNADELYFGTDSDGSGAIDLDEQYFFPYTYYDNGMGNMILIDMSDIPNPYYILFGTFSDGNTVMIIQKEYGKLIFPMEYRGSWAR